MGWLLVCLAPSVPGCLNPLPDDQPASNGNPAAEVPVQRPDTPVRQEPTGSDNEQSGGAPAGSGSESGPIFGETPSNLPAADAGVAGGDAGPDSGTVVSQ